MAKLLEPTKNERLYVQLWLKQAISDDTLKERFPYSKEVLKATIRSINAGKKRKHK